MIGKLAGRLDSKGGDHVLVDVNGVGYVVHCAQPTLAALPGPGAPVALFTDLLVRQDLLQLFGFLTPAEREWHRLLTGVQGVGAKAALSIAGALGVEGLSRAVMLDDVAAIRAAPGIGPKLAQRVVVELKDKAAAIVAMGAEGARPAAAWAAAPEPVGAGEAVVSPPVAPAAPAAPSVGEAAAARADALSALINLGYGQGEAAAAVAEVGAAFPDEGVEALIRRVLAHMAPKG